MSHAAALRSASEPRPPRGPKAASREIFAKRRAAQGRSGAYRFVASRENACIYEKARQDRQSLQTDPIGYEDDLNLYQYVGNDPHRTDPTGEIECADQNCDTARISPQIPTGPPPIDSSIEGTPNQSSVSVTFVNDDPNGASPNQPIDTDTAIMVESAIAESGVSSVNINSTTGGGHDPRSLHYGGEAVDINRVNGERVDNPQNIGPVSDLQEAIANQPGIRENYGPARNERTERDGTVRPPSERIVRAHRNHIHAGGPRQ